MAKLIATNSKDNIKRFDIKIDFRISLNDIINCVYYQVSANGEYVPTNRNKAIDYVKGTVKIFKNPSLIEEYVDPDDNELYKTISVKMKRLFLDLID